jgi:general secretion pathway protein G
MQCNNTHTRTRAPALTHPHAADTARRLGAQRHEETAPREIQPRQAAPRVMGYFGASKGKAAKIQIQNIVTTLDLYKMDNNAYPSETQGLKALVEKPEGATNWNGPYLTRADGIIDPWDRPYLYKVPGVHGAVDVSSLGADGKDGGTGEDQDISSW